MIGWYLFAVTYFLGAVCCRGAMSLDPDMRGVNVVSVFVASAPWGPILAVAVPYVVSINIYRWVLDRAK
jgi:hypothetical protein